MSFLRVRQLKRTLTLCHSCVRLTNAHLTITPRYTLLNSQVGRTFCSRSAFSQHLAEPGENLAESTINHDEQVKLLDNLLNILSEYSTTRQRIDKKDIVNVIDILRSDRSITLSYNDALLLLRCCGKYMPKEARSVRTSLLNTLWDVIRDSGWNVNISHYNARLLAMLDNDESFLVHEELAAIDKAGLRANRTTYQIMIDRLCRDGDVFVANEMKIHMEEIGIPIMPIVYHNFIKAKIQNGNLEEVENAKAIMIDAGYNVDARAYSAMIDAYGLKGDLEAIKQLIYAAEDSGVNLDVNEMKAGLVNLCKIGQEEKAIQLVDMMPAKGPLAQSLVNCMLETLALGCNDVALDIYRKMEPSFPSRTSNAIIVKMISNGESAKVITETWNSLKAENRYSRDFDEIVLLSMHLGTPDQILDFIDMMHEKGKPIWAHFFTPAIKKCLHENNCEGLSKVLRKMITLSEDMPDPVFYFAFTIYDDLQVLSSDTMDVIKNSGFSEDDLDKITIFDHLVKGNIKEALELCRQKNCKLSVQLLNYWTMKKIGKCKDYITAIEMVRECLLVASKVVNTRLLSAMARDRNISLPLLEEALQYFIEQKMLVFSDEKGFKPIMSDLRWRGISPQLIEQIGRLQTDEVDVSQKTVMPQPGSVFEGEREDRYMRRRNLQANVQFLEKEAELSKLIRNNQREEAYGVKSWLESRGYELKCRSLVALAAMEVRLGYIDEAMEIKCHMDALDEKFNYTSLILDIAGTLITLGRSDEALHILEQYSDNGKRKKPPANTEWISRVIQNSVKFNDFDTTKMLVDALMQFIDENSNPQQIIVPLMEEYQRKNNGEEMVEVMKFCKDRFNQIHGFKETMTMLIEQKDAENLQKVVDILAEWMGEKQAVFHLMNALIKKGQWKEALQLSKTTRVTPNVGTLTQVMQSSEPEIGESIAEATQDMPGINRDEILFYLIKTWCNKNDCSKALEAFDKYKEEGINPSNRTLRYLGNALKNQQLPIPFDVPWVQTPTEFKSLDDILSLRDSKSRQLEAYERQLKVKQEWASVLDLYIIQGDFGKAVDLVESQRSSHHSIDAVVEKLHQLKDLETLEKVAVFLKYTKASYNKELFHRNLVFCYTHILELAVDNGDARTCKKLLREAREDDIDLHISPAMKTLLKNHNQKMPLSKSYKSTNELKKINKYPIGNRGEGYSDMANSENTLNS